jgi:hypothetical protein
VLIKSFRVKTVVYQSRLFVFRKGHAGLIGDRFPIQSGRDRWSHEALEHPSKWRVEDPIIPIQSMARRLWSPILWSVVGRGSF